MLIFCWELSAMCYQPFGQARQTEETTLQQQRNNSLFNVSAFKHCLVSTMYRVAICTFSECGAFLASYELSSCGQHLCRQFQFMYNVLYVNLE